MTANELSSAGVVGAGQMGAGIAQVLCQHGLTVLLADVSVERAERAREGIARQLARQVEKGRLPEAEREAALGRLRAVGSLSEFAGVDFAIEAASEAFSLKQALFRELDATLPPQALLLTNTSSISVTRLGAETDRPDRVAGMHFMNPVPVMKLCEVVRGLATSDATLALVVELGVRLEKTIIISKDRPGFLVNRILIPFLNEACFALDERVGSARDIDAGARLGLNHPLGPLELADLIGLDTVLAIARVLYEDFADDKYRPAPLLKNLVAAGYLGKKAGRGFYLYDQQGTRGEPADAAWEIAMTDLSVSTLDQAVLLTISRPEKLNALNLALLIELRERIEGFAREPAQSRPRAVILTGAGDKAFVAGADIAELAELGAPQARALSETGHRLGRAMEEAPFPVIAAVNGFALGGGLELALCADFIYASERAKFGLPEVGLGLIPGFGGTQRLARRIGAAAAREIIYTGRVFDAAEALGLGLVNRVFPAQELLPKTAETCAAIAAKGPLAIAAAKRVMLRGEDVDLTSGCELEAHAFGNLFATADASEGTRAFLEKRKPAFGAS